MFDYLFLIVDTNLNVPSTNTLITQSSAGQSSSFQQNLDLHSLPLKTIFYFYCIKCYIVDTNLNVPPTNTFITQSSAGQSSSFQQNLDEAAFTTTENTNLNVPSTNTLITQSSAGQSSSFQQNLDEAAFTTTENTNLNVPSTNTLITQSSAGQSSSFQQNVNVDAQAWFTDTENTNLIVPSTNTSCAGESTINIANALIDLHHSHSPQFINSQKGKPLLFYNMFLYRIDHHKDLISYYKCRNISCKGRCKYDGIYTMTCGHCHQHDTYIYEKLSTKEVIEILVAKNPQVYDKAMQIRFSECLDIAEYPEAIPSFVSFKTTIDRILKKYRPVLPYAVEEIILTPVYFKYAGGTIPNL
ncbi:uncharacterized protein LOC135928661 [Gordionus sp. m RMFG-2023]|uniref:uncharacterized protein LOC135928661 n=1 Tax=Gordionus sp. m RMFG-2023 TaxID=3053472 RepID=UPI0031FC18E6